ncbi:MAG: hypothetical protein ACTSRI_07415, partial [Promethearchaeota archaeon]
GLRAGWELYLVKFIKRANKKDIPSDTKKELIKTLEEHRDFEDLRQVLDALLRKDSATNLEKKEIRELAEKLGKKTPLQVSMFKTFRKFMNFYLKNISWNDDRLHGEMEKFTKHLAKQLEFLRQVVLIEKNRINRKIIQNPEKVRQLIDLVDIQIEHHEKTGEEKYSLGDISRIIGYKGIGRLKNTIESYIGDLLCNQIFTRRMGNQRMTLDEIEAHVKNIGISKTGVEGKITPRGIEMYKRAIEEGIYPSKAMIEVDCQIKGHKPWETRVYNLKPDKWCSKCLSIINKRIIQNPEKVRQLKDSVDIQIELPEKISPCENRKELINQDFNNIENLGEKEKKVYCKISLQGKKIIQNPEKVRLLIDLVDIQKEHYEKTGKKKYSINYIGKIIGYKDRNRLKNTIKSYIGDLLCIQIFGNRKIIQNPEKVRLLIDLVDIQIEHHEKTGEEKYSMSDISRIIGYKDRTRIKNTIKSYIGDLLYSQIFGKKKIIKNPEKLLKITLDELKMLVKDLGRSKSGTDGIITPKGIEMFKKAIEGGITPLSATIEVDCQIKGHPPMEKLVYNLVKGRWCPKCGHQNRMLTYVQAKASGLRNGFYLKETPVTFAIKMKNRGEKVPSEVPLDWVCENNHKSSKPSSEISRGGCMTCFRESQIITFTQAKEIAEKKGYSLAMTEKEFNDAIKEARKKGITPSVCKLKWSCGKHTWPTSYNNMKSTAVCPHCRSRYYERRTRRLFKRIFGLDFLYAKKRDVLKDGSHGNIHFDGYNSFKISGKEVKLAFEFNGYQHYKFPNFFHRYNEKAFLRQRTNDEDKVNDCKEKKVVLIVVPYKLYKLPKANTAVINHIIKEFERQVRIFYDDPQFKFDKKGVNFDNLDKFLKK